MVWFDLSRSGEIIKHDVVSGYAAEAPHPSKPVLIDIVEVIPVIDDPLEQVRQTVDNTDQ
jgi:hypothetical protein